jgi:predicted permease
MPSHESRGIRPRIARLFRLAIHDAERARDDADDEIALHLALRVAQLQREGLSPDAARAEAERRFGSLEEARRTLHDSSIHREARLSARDRIDGLQRDLRFAIRGLRRSPGFTMTAVLCLALGVGANAATFSMFDELVLRPLPVTDPDRLVNFAVPGPRAGTDNCNEAGRCDEVVSFPMFRDLERTQQVFTGIAAHRMFLANIASSTGAVFGQATLVSGSYFPVLGLRPALGRLIGPSDDGAVGAPPIAVITWDYWKNHLGGDPAVLGTSLVVNDQRLTIVGVAPRGFEGTTLGMKPVAFVPLTMAPLVNPMSAPSSGFRDRKLYWLYLFARLRPGVSIEQARAAMQPVYRTLLADVEAPVQGEMTAETWARFKARELTIEDGRRGQSTLEGQTRTPLVLLFSITGLVVLIACANIANLLLARAATRTTEMAVRLSLGASRRRLIFQLLTESCLLAIIGGIVSLGVAYATLGLIGSLIPPAGGVGSGATLALDLHPSALAFAAGMSLGTGLLFGMFPAFHATRTDLVASIRGGSGATGARAAARFRTSLVTAQIALSMALLISAGLFVRSLRNVSRVDTWIDVERVVGFGIAPIFNGYSAERTLALFTKIETDLRALPGVAGVAASGTPLLASSTSGVNVRVEGFRREADTDANTRINEVGPGYFGTLGIPLLAGREFSDADGADAPKVAIVSEAFAKKFGLGANPIGRRMAADDVNRRGPLDIEIVGLARDAKYDAVKGEIPPLFFVPYRQANMNGGMIFYVRSANGTEQLLQSIPAAIAKLDPNLPLVSLKPMSQQVRENTYLDRMIGILSAAFAGVATLLTAVGLYGVLAFTVAQRTREIGLRMALGADVRRVRRMVLMQVGRMTVIGGALGIAAALAIGRAAQSLLFGLDGQDPVTVVGSALVIAVVAAAAGYVPAWRASRVEPMRALRAE